MKAKLLKAMIARKMDRLGRVGIPKEIRDQLKINKRTRFEVFVDENEVVALKILPERCCLCGATENLVSVPEEENTYICEACTRKVKKI